MTAAEKAIQDALYKFYKHRIEVLKPQIKDFRQVKIGAQFSTEDLESQARRMVRDGVYNEVEISDWILAQI